MTKIMSWNVDGLGTLTKKGFFDLLQKEKPAIICLQETKHNEDRVAKLLKSLTDEYHLDCISSRREDISGYSGVATLSRLKPTRTSTTFGSNQFDKEGRILMSEFPEFILYNCYFPTGVADPKYQKMKRVFYKECAESIRNTLASGKEIILCGDFNTARDERDVAEALRKRVGPGFLPEDREDIEKFFILGLIDAFRKDHDEAGHYTWWSSADFKNKAWGWRIDYFLVSPGLEDRIQTCTHFDKIGKDDHCPVILELEDPE